MGYLDLVKPPKSKYGTEPSRLELEVPTYTTPTEPISETGGGGGIPQSILDTGAYQDWLDLFSYMSGATDDITSGALSYYGTLESGGQITPDYISGGGGFGGDGFVAPLSPGGGGIKSPSDAVFSDIDINIPGSPEWWSAVSPDVLNPISEYQTLTNLLIPFLSPEDQFTVSANLFQSDPEQFARYNPELIEREAIPSEITAATRRKFFSGERAQKTLGAFDQLLTLSGKKAEDFGPGYNYLRTIADTLQDFTLTSGAGQLTETQQGQLLGALDPILAQSKSGNLGAYGPIAKSFANPFFSAGSLTGKVRNQFGNVINPPNPRYF